VKECVKCGTEHEKPYRRWAGYPVCSRACWVKMVERHKLNEVAVRIQENRETGNYVRSHV